MGIVTEEFSPSLSN